SHRGATHQLPTASRWVAANARNIDEPGVSAGYDAPHYVFCTHLHIDHCGWNTVLRDGRWVPTFPKAKYIFHKREYAAWEEATKRGDTPPGNVWRYNCEPVVAA